MYAINLCIFSLPPRRATFLSPSNSRLQTSAPAESLTKLSQTLGPTESLERLLLWMQKQNLQYLQHFCTSNTSTPAPSLPAPSFRDAAMHEPVVWERERGNGCNHRTIIMLPLPVTDVASTSRSIFRAPSDASSPNSTVEYWCRWGAKKVSQTVKKCCTLPRYQRIHWGSRLRILGQKPDCVLRVLHCRCTYTVVLSKLPDRWFRMHAYTNWHAKGISVPNWYSSTGRRGNFWGGLSLHQHYTMAPQRALSRPLYTRKTLVFLIDWSWSLYALKIRLNAYV